MLPLLGLIEGCQSRVQQSKLSPINWVLLLSLISAILLIGQPIDFGPLNFVHFQNLFNFQSHMNQQSCIVSIDHACVRAHAFGIYIPTQFYSVRFNWYNLEIFWLLHVFPIRFSAMGRWLVVGLSHVGVCLFSFLFWTSCTK